MMFEASSHCFVAVLPPPGQRCGTVCLNSFGNRTSPSDNSNDRWKRLCLVSWAAAPCVWTLRAVIRNLFTYLLTDLSVYSACRDCFIYDRRARSEILVTFVNWPQYHARRLHAVEIRRVAQFTCALCIRFTFDCYARHRRDMVTNLFSVTRPNAASNINTYDIYTH